MRVTFVAMGWENISIECLSAFLKKHGHECSLAYDQCLFDDKNYVCVPLLQKLLNNSSSVIEQIIDSKPDLLAISVLTVTYNWALRIAKVIKKELNIPIIFGGIHPTSVPETVIAEDDVDMICISEGEYPLLELCNSMERGENRTDIENIWFKDNNGNIIRNVCRKPIEDIDSLPPVDKDLFASHVPIKNYYLACIARGCPYNCTYCSVTVENEINKKLHAKSFRIHSVDYTINELRTNLYKYKYKWVDFRNSVFAVNPKWIVEFCERYRNEINVPFRIFMNPNLISEEVVEALVGAKCFSVQIGLESFDEILRNSVLGRMESNAQIFRAIEILEKYRARYTLDYILGLPGQTTNELDEVARFFAKLKYCYRLSPFMCQYLPGLKLTAYALKIGEISPGDIEQINNGCHGNYMANGSVYDKKKLKELSMYKILFRSMSFMPPFLKKVIIKSDAYKIFKYVNPNYIIKLLDIIILIRDMDARTYFYNYLWWIIRRMSPSHPTFVFRKNKYAKNKLFNLLIKCDNQ